jgi:predicted CXXCH cytochrome family protein
MPNRRPDRGRRGGPAALAALAAAGLACGLGAALEAQSTADLLNTKHNLSVSGPGPVRALTEDRVCVFCHTPHNATPQSPLWNRELEPQAYAVYASPTLGAGPMPQPSGPTKLCLSCHDGTVAMGAVVVPPGGIAMAGSGNIPPGHLANFGVDLSAHHPVSFPYSASLPNSELASAPPEDLTFGAADELHCVTCHDPHDDQYGQFLSHDNRYSALCVRCHQIPGWATSEHATSGESVGGALPRPPRTDPSWDTLAEWGCETCHAPHSAATPQQLLNFTAGPPRPFSCTSAGCHSSEPGEPPHSVAAPGAVGAHRLAASAGQTRADIAGQVKKPSAHHETPGVYSTSNQGPGGAGRSGIRGVGCADCHDPHLATRVPAEAPFASGRLSGVSGVDRNGVPMARATYEYEVCFKCHADNSGDFERVPRVLGSTNTRLDFDPSNSSSHPVVGSASGAGSPSLRGSVDGALLASGAMYCTSCHADDENVSNGPHGSMFAPILRERYDLEGGGESYDAYALCYRCHDRASILGNQSFAAKSARTTASGGGHAGHLAAGASCATCHDPHGVPDQGRLGGSESGSHTHLVNFDTRAVQPLPGAPAPIFEDTGLFAGNCTLVCHGVAHDRSAYP